MQPLSDSQRKSLATAATTYREQMNDECRDYLAGRGLNAETVNKFGFGLVSTAISGHEYLQGRLVIPYIGPRRNVYNLRFRCLRHEDCKAEGCDSKYMSLPGYPSRVFNVRSLVSAGDSINVTEGELDSVTLEVCGLYSVGIPGVDNMPAHLSRMLAGFSSITFWADGDEAGRKLASRFMKHVPSARTLILCAGEDVNSVFIKEGRSGIMNLLEDGL